MNFVRIAIVALSNVMSLSRAITTRYRTHCIQVRRNFRDE